MLFFPPRKIKCLSLLPLISSLNLPVCGVEVLKLTFLRVKSRLLLEASYDVSERSTTSVSNTNPHNKVTISSSSSSLHGLGESPVPASSIVVSLSILFLFYLCLYCVLKLSHYTPRRRLGEKRYISYSFSTSALDGGEWSASRPGRALAPGKGPPLPIVQEAGWTPEPVWTQRLEERCFRLCRGSNPDHQVVQPVARLLTELPGSPVITALTQCHGQ
jgi:hypothetical protein